MKIMEEIKKKMKRSNVLIGMLTVQVIATGLQLLSKVILSHGTFVFALMSYRHVVATLCIAPFALIWERESLKKVTWSIFFWLFMIALTGIIMAMGLFYYGLKDTTATYATNFLNLIPIVTFILSTVLRVEKLRLKTKAGKVKLLGAMLCLAGALTITLYKGKVFHVSHHDKHQNSSKDHANMLRGTIFLMCSCMSYGCWFLIQAKVSKVFPYKYSATFIICMIATIQSAIVGVCIDRRKASWKLGLNLQLITIFYSGALATAATFCLISWAVERRGPTYPSMFNPLSLIFVAIAEAVFLGQETSIGSLLGMFLIIVGLYSFLRAKSKELTQIGSSNAGDTEAPPPENEVTVHPSPTSNMELPILAHESARFQSKAIEVAIPPIQTQEEKECL
ncbi:WAT1-related protein At5g64700-like [Lycium ferocissimum]|uniref:WAT1-related protein At5g64700-like n=1 Tax=Lycium ferocissimum TaxID=112874 RepID=UPI0028161309|nr:WAT1-related protein At5g64700-like [Lycium ferocissimum]XP_059277044.1 WAT1-related protein At5g64700-like [Lycium ferocissimum]